MGVLSKRALKGLAAYEYHSGDYTWLDNAHQPFWNGVAERLPLWLAPNLVTLIGTSTLVLSYLITLCYSPTLTEELPAWVGYFNAAALFFYVTMDAVDGKQARRTGASSPLGQLFDHGCDAVATGLMTTTMAATMGSGASWGSIFQLYLGMAPFFIAQWAEYHTGVLSTATGNIGVTEVEYMIIFVYAATAALGQGVWRADVLAPLASLGLPLPAVSVTWVFNCGGLLSLLVSMVPSVKKVLAGTRAEHLKARPGNKVLMGDNKVPALLQLIPVQATFLLAFLWVHAPAAQWEKSMVRIILATTACIFQWNVVHVILSHMAKEPMGAAIWPVPAMAAVVWMVYMEPFGGAVEWWLAAGLCLVLHAAYLSWVVRSIQEICGHLGIKCFTIRKLAKK
mmetsp:Transcript_21242/g.67232  ORF Transcript_21242/g.67232 Transcript_21242/m.67232 type:complete len:395 (-) Transcript_21242:510-1694(-)